MKPILALYWLLAYTAGIVCITGLAFRRAQRREKSTGRLLVFLIGMAVAVTALPLRELSDAGVGSRLAGILALAAAGLTVASFPRYAASLDDVPRREKRAVAFLGGGLSLCLLDLVLGFLPFPGPARAAGVATLLSLAFAVYVSLAWISRSRVPRADRAWMAFFFLFSGLVVFLDFMGGWDLVAPRMGGRILLFPAFYVFLNVSLFRTHLRSWTHPVPDPALLGRYGISGREEEVLLLLAKGRTYREVADELYISLSTVKSHVDHLYTKTDCRNKVELLNRLRVAERG